MFDDVMTSNIAKQTFHSAILTLFGIKSPIVKLANMPHWGESESIISKKNTYLLAGYYYNFSTKLDADFIVEDYHQIINLNNVDQVLIPSVRLGKEGNILYNLKFKPMNLSCEFIFVIGKNIDSSLKTAVGSSRWREICRLNRKAHNEFSLEFISSNELSDFILENIDNLDKIHCELHNVKNRIYQGKIHQLFSISPLSKHFTWIIRRHKQSNEVVQYGLLLEGETGGTLYYLTQSIDRKKLATGHNLYIATFYDVYTYAFNKGFSAVHMGRSGDKLKRSLGANFEFTQQSWLNTI